MLSALLLAAAMFAAPPSAAAGAVDAAGIAPPLTPSFRHYGEVDGLPSDATYTAVQDHSGYLWIGTRDGLARFDGNTFRIFRHDPKDHDSLPANDVSAVLVDAQGRLWVGGEANGLNLYHPERDGFTHWLHDPRDSRSLSGNDVLSIAQDAEGNLWVGVYAGGLNRLLANQRDFSHVRHRNNDPVSLLSDNVSSLAPAADGGLWIGTDAGLQHRDRTGHLIHIVLAPDVATAAVWQLTADAGGVDVDSDAGFFHVDAQRRAQRIGASSVTYASLRDSDGGVWIARQGGLDLVSANGITRHYAPHNGVAGSLTGAVPVGLVQDDEGGVWISLLDGGLDYLPPQWRAFDAWRHVPEDAASLASNRVIALARAPDATLLVGGTNGVLDRLDPHTGAVEHLSAAVDLKRSSINAVAEDSRGRLWIGHQFGLRLDDQGRLRDIDFGGDSKRNTVRLLQVARDGAVYMAGLENGVSRIDPETLALTALAAPAPGSAARQVREFRENKDGTIWAASGAGLARLAPGDNSFHFVPGVARGGVDAFAFAPDGTLWLARNDSLQHYSLGAVRSHALETVDGTDGWPAVTVGGLAVDADGHVWATTPRGLFGYDPVTRHTHLYALAEGLGNPEFARYTLLPDIDGNLYAGSLGGVIGIRTAALNGKTPVPQVVLAALSVRRDGQTLQLDPRKPVTLRWDDRELTATAHALSFVDPQLTHYRFLLAGFDPDWINTAERDTREFSSLRSGDYSLKVEAAIGASAWGIARTPLAVHIATPPWATPWAQAIYAIAIALLIGLIVWTTRRRLEQRHRYALIAQRQQFAEQASAAKTHFLSGMAHEIRTPMTGVLGMTELLLNTPLDVRQRGYADGIRRSGALLMRQVNDALDLARIEAGKLELGDAPFDPATLLQEITALEQGLAAQKGLALQVAIGDDAPRALRGDALRLQQVLLNLVHNALKFTRSGGVRLILERDNPGAVFTVSDSGPGMSAEECARVFQRFEQTEAGRRGNGSGLGLAISRELVALMGGRVELHSEPGVGSTFRVHVPLAECASIAQPPVSNAAGQVASVARNLLLVEDDAVAAEVISGLLQAQGHSVTHAPNALAALAEVETATRAFDIILLDLDLPGMDGCTLAMALRERGYAGPMLAVTASSRGDEETRIAAAGINALLRKPILPDTLREALEKVSEGRIENPDHHPGRGAVATRDPS